MVFNALHGPFGEDGTIQGVLDYIGIPYTHSGVRASALAMDKAAAKAVFAAAGLPVAPHRIIDIAELADHDPLPPPYVVKPVNEGSSVGVSIVKAGDNNRAEIVANWHYGPAMVEQYIPGRELTVGVLEDHALAVTEILPARKNSTTITPNMLPAARAMWCPRKSPRLWPSRRWISRWRRTGRWGAAAPRARICATTTIPAGWCCWR